MFNSERGKHALLHLLTREMLLGARSEEAEGPVLSCPKHRSSLLPLPAPLTHINKTSEPQPLLEKREFKAAQITYSHFIQPQTNWEGVRGTGRVPAGSRLRGILTFCFSSLSAKV